MTSTMISAPTDEDRQERRRHRLSELGEWLGVFGVAANVAAFTELDWVAGYGGTDTSFGELQVLGEHGGLSGFPGAWFGIAGWIAFGAVAVLVVLARHVCVRTQRPTQGLAVVAAAVVAGADVAATATVRGVGDLAPGFGPGLWLAVSGYGLLIASAVLTRTHRED